MKNIKQFVDRKERNSSIELLRIIAMFLIVLHHFSIHGGFTYDNSTISIPHLWYNLIMMGGKIGVDIFILISGYFLIENKNIYQNVRKVLKLAGQVFFYSVMLYSVFHIMSVNEFSIKTFIKAIFPITYSEWWFVSTYFVLLLIHPILNKLLHYINKNTYQSLLLLLIVCWSIIPTFTNSSFQSNSLIWFVTLYSVAGYIKLYGLNPKLKTNHYLIVLIFMSTVTYLSSVVITILGMKWIKFSLYTFNFYGQEKLTIFIISVSLFMIFTSIKMNYHKWINVIASATFGVYLIHENPMIRMFLWKDIFRNSTYQDSLALIPYSIVVALLVFVICTLFDLLRQKYIERYYIAVINKNLDSWIKFFAIIVNYVKSIFFGKETNIS